MPSCEWRQEADIGCLLLSHPTLSFETRSLAHLELTQQAKLTGQQALPVFGLLCGCQGSKLMLVQQAPLLTEARGAAMGRGEERGEKKRKGDCTEREKKEEAGLEGVEREGEVRSR